MASFQWPPVVTTGGGGGTVTGVTGSAPISINGSPTVSPNVMISQASGSEDGYLSSIDWTTFNNKQSTLTLGNLTDAGTDGITVTGGTNSVVGSGTSLSQHVSDATHNGYLSSSDWSTFNNKQASLTLGNLTDAGTDGITVTGGSGAVVGSGTSISQHVADATHNGYLASADWSTFNGKQAAGSYITALTGDATASGPGPAALTLATVNGNVGTFGSSTLIPSITVNAKGLITAVSTNAVNLPSPLEAVVSYTSNFWGGPGTFVGNISDSDQTNAVIVLGSTDTSVAANLTSNVVLLAGDNLAASSTGDAGGVYIQGGNVLTGSGFPGAVNVVAGNGDSAQGGTLNLQAGISNTGQGGNLNVQAGGTSAGTQKAGDLQLTSGSSFGGVAGNVVIEAGTGTTNGSVSLEVQGATGKIKLSDASVGTSGQVWTSTDAFGSGHWAAPAASPTSTYYSGFTDNAASWSTTSTTLVDGTNSGGNALTTRKSNGLTVTAAASNVAGITFTPAASTSIYIISAVVQVQASASNNQCSYSLTDGSTVIQQTSRLGPLISSAEVITFSGIFAPGTGSAVTVKLQIATSTGTAYIMAVGSSVATPVIEWSVIQIK